MDCDIVLKKVLGLWRECGAKLNGEPKKVQYLLKQARPDDITLSLDYGVPRRLCTPNYIYEIATTEYGRVDDFAEKFLKVFDYTVANPIEAKKESLRNIARAYAPLVIIINKVK